MKVIIAPDKFKGSLSSFDVCKHIRSGLAGASIAIESISFPMADGGDGFGSVLQYYYNTTTIPIDTVDPIGRKIKSSYEWDDKNGTAIIEVAAASGLVLLNESERNPLITSTYGTGLMIRDAIRRKAGKIILGLGGSATNDAGTGILSAMGFQFLDAKQAVLPANGKNLRFIQKIIVPERMPQMEFVIACDVYNVMHGPEGAAHIYAKQKGADVKSIHELDEGLQNFASIVYKQTNNDISKIPGTGAAGGIAAGLKSFFNVEIKSGIELVIHASNIIKSLEEVDLIITGEGKIDVQTTRGKVIAGITALARKYQIPVIAICGNTDISSAQSEELGLKGVYRLKTSGLSLSQSMMNAGKLIETKITQIIKDFLRE